MAGSDKIPVDIEFLFKSLNVGKEAANIKKEIIDVGTTTDKVTEQVEANFTEAFTKASAEAAKTNAAFARGATGAAQFARGNQQLTYSMQQVARELPSLAISPQMFFLAISNNLPILQDQIRRTRLENEALKASGSSVVPVWRQLVKSLFSWQTALVAGITILTVYGKEITQWVKSLFSGKDALEGAAKAMEDFRTTTRTGIQEAQKDITKLDLLYKAATDVKKSTEERTAAVKELQKVYPQYLGNISEEALKTGNAVTAYQNLKTAIMEAAVARAYANKISEIRVKITDLEAEREKKIAQYNQSVAKATKLGKTPGGSSIILGVGGRVPLIYDPLKDAKEIETQIEQLKKDIERYARNINVSDLLFGSSGSGSSAVKIPTGIQKTIDEINKLREKLGSGTVQQDVELQVEILNKQEVVDDFYEQVREALKKLFRDDVKITALTPVSPTNISAGISEDASKALKPMKVLTAEQKKQLEQQGRLASDTAVQTENYEKTVPVMAEMLYYAQGVTSELAEQLGLNEDQANVLNNGVKAMSGMAEIASGNVIQGAATLFEATSKLFLTAPEKIQEQFKAIEAQVNVVIDSLNIAQETLINLNSPDILSSLAIIDSGLVQLAKDAKALNKELSSASYGGGRRGATGVIYGDLMKQAADLNEEIEKLTNRLLKGDISNDQREAINALLGSYNSLMGQIDAMTRELTGTTVSDFSKALSDAVLEGADAWDVWEEKAIDVIKHVASQQLASQLLTEPITDAINVLVKASGDGLSADEALNFKETIKAIYEEVGPAYEAAVAALESVGINVSAGNGYDALSGSSISATEESVSLLYGQITALRIDVKSILLQMASNDDDFVRRLAYLKEIAENTRYNRRLETIEKHLGDMLKLQKDKL